MKKEYDVVMLGSLIKRTDEEDSILNKAIEEGVNWIEVGGILLNHRLSGYFYNNVSNQNLQTIPEEMRKNLKALIKGQEIEQIRLSKYIKEIDAALKDTSIKYAGLKGIIFGAGLYKAGVRRSNDIDLLVYEEDLDKLDCIFRKIAPERLFSVSVQLQKKRRPAAGMPGRRAASVFLIREITASSRPRPQWCAPGPRWCAACHPAKTAAPAPLPHTAPPP